MSNLSLLFNSNSNKKIIIEDTSDDSDDSDDLNNLNNSNNLHFSKKINNNQLIIKQSIKKTLISKINNNDTDNSKLIFKNNNNKTNKLKKNYIKNHILINKTKEILEKSYDDYHNALETYYNEVLEWMNNLYNDASKSIMQLKFKKITLNEDIFNTYNVIIKKYKLNKNIFDIENFDIEDFHDNGQLFKIAKIMTNNLLEKLGYKLDVYKNGNFKQYKINNITNGI